MPRRMVGIFMMTHLQRHPAAVDFFISQYQCPRPVNWARQFDRTAPLDLEIGFGLGEFLIRTAEQNPERNFVGIEYDGLRIKKTLRRIERINALSAPAQGLRNIRVLQIDAHVALERLFRPRSLARVFCLFPCPWPKKKHIKYRLFSREFLRLVNSRLQARGFLHIVTDHKAYRDWIVSQDTRCGFRLTSRVIRPGYDTKYERKWIAAGQKKFYELVFTKTRHIAVGLRRDAVLKTFYLPDFPGPDFRFRNRTGDPAIILKKLTFDSRRKSGMLHFVVAERNLTQYVCLRVVLGCQGWEIALAEDQPVLPTPGVARAVREVFLQAKTQMKQGCS